MRAQGNGIQLLVYIAGLADLEDPTKNLLVWDNTWTKKQFLSKLKVSTRILW